MSTDVGIRNTDSQLPIQLVSERCHDTLGKLIRSYGVAPVTIPPLGTNQVFVQRTATAAGSWLMQRPIMSLIANGDGVFQRFRMSSHLGMGQGLADLRLDARRHIMPLPHGPVPRNQNVQDHDGPATRLARAQRMKTSPCSR